MALLIHRPMSRRLLCFSLLVALVAASSPPPLPPSLSSRVLRPPQPPSPTPQHAQKPTPRPTRFADSQPIATSLSSADELILPRVNVHVMEKCCPYISHFVLRDYPSQMEDDGWAPGLTFHAFKYNRSLANCWQIVNATAAGSAGSTAKGSQLWKRLRPETAATAADTTKSTVDIHANNSFCLPTSTRLPDPRFAVYYARSADNRASFLTQPLLNPPRDWFQSFSLSGWSSTAAIGPAATPAVAAAPPRALFTQIHPLAFYFWRPMTPLRLLRDVRMHVAARDPPAISNPKDRACPVGYEKVEGDFNFNFVMDPFVFFCYKYAPGTVANPFLNLTSNRETFVTKISLILNTGEPRNNCPNGGELMATSQNYAALAGLSKKTDQTTGEVSQMTEMLIRLGLPANYTLKLGSHEVLQFCVEKEPLLTPNGWLQDASAFVERLYLNTKRISRKSRLGMVYNFDSLDLGKQSPHGRLVEEHEKKEEDDGDDQEEEEEKEEEEDKDEETEEQHPKWAGRVVFVPKV